VAVKLRLMRMGKTKQPTYRVVAADGRSPRDGRFIEILGSYDPRQEPSVVKIDVVKADEWIAKGAQPTDRVRTLLAIARNAPAAPVEEASTPAPVEEAPAE
jgi:small subunit ribosomal protein S16